MKPVWLLDVDGVINANRPGWHQVPHHGYATDSRGYRYKIRWAPGLVTQIKKLHAEDEVEIRWCTTWCEDISEIEVLLHMPKLTAEPVPCHLIEDTLQAKGEAALRVVRSGRPLIWTDDDAVPPDYDEIFWDWMREAGQPYLIIQPQARTGLSPEHIEKIREFIANPKMES
jgi:hypothetical protein